MSGTTEPLQFQEFPVLEAMVHPNYTVANLKQNVAILTTNGAIPFGQIPTINNICVPSELKVSNF